MRIQSISQETSIDTSRLITTVVINEVMSHCILARQLIATLGRPGVDSDMEMIGTDDTWTIIWTQPQLDLEEVTERVHQAIGA